MTSEGNQPSTAPPGLARQTSRASYNSYDSTGADESQELNENFALGKQGLPRTGTRNQTRHSVYSEIDQLDYYTPDHNAASANRLSNYDGKPVGVVSPQATSFRDAFRVLPAAATDKSLLRPTPLSTRPKSYNEVSSSTGCDLIADMLRVQANNPVVFNFLTWISYQILHCIGNPYRCISGFKMPPIRCIYGLAFTCLIYTPHSESYMVRWLRMQGLNS